MYRSIRRIACALALSLVPQLAQAQTAIVPPLVSKAGVGSLVLLNITSLVASELDFLMAYDEVKQLDKKPATLGLKCLGSSSCLRAITKAEGGNVIVAGSVAKMGNDFNLTLVLYNADKSTFVRKKTWRTSSDPTQMADKMAAFVRELATGKTPTQAKKDNDLGGLADATDADLFGDEDDFAFDDPDELEVGRRIATPSQSDYNLDDFEDDGDDSYEAQERARNAAAARERAEEEEQRRVEEARRRAEAAAAQRVEEERRRAEAEAARKAEEAQRQADAETARRVEAAARRDAASRAQDSDDDFSFAPVNSMDIEVEMTSATSFIEVESNNDATADAFGYDDTPARTSNYDLDEDPLADVDDDYYDDLDAEPTVRSTGRDAKDRSSSRARSSSRDRSSSRGRSASSDRSSTRSSARVERGGSSSTKGRTTLTGRLGTSGYYDLQFLTYGGELALPLGGGASFTAGIEGYSVRREFEKAFCEDVNVPEGMEITTCTRWNTILPLHLGARYQPSTNPLRPYFGGDFVFGPYTENFDLVAGLRGRAGVDYMANDGFGLNLNFAVGFLYGSEFDKVQEGVEDSGLNWQLSAGTVFAL